MKRISFLLALLMTRAAAHAEGTSAADLVATCGEVSNALSEKGKYIEAHPKAIYSMGQCEGFLEGWLQGIDGAIVQSDGKAATLYIRWGELPSMWKIAGALTQHLKETPLDSGKSADSILLKVLRANGLIEVKAFVAPTSEVQ